GVRDIVTDGSTGFVVETGDVDAVAERLARLAADPELRSRMGAEGRARTGTRYSIPRLVRDVDLLYRELLEQAEPRARSVVSSARPLPRALPGARVAHAERQLRIVLRSEEHTSELQ